MRVRLKKINWTTKRLADGTIKTYWYAWRGGPALEGKPGAPEFIASYNAAVAQDSAKLAVGATLSSLLDYFQSTSEFKNDISARTQVDYFKQIKIIEAEFGDFPLSALGKKETRGIFKEWRDRRAETSIRQADYGWVVLARVLSVALDRGKIDVNPCARGGRLYQSDRAEIVWTEADEAAYFAAAAPYLHLPVLLALWTGQREGDLLRLRWWQYDGQFLRNILPNKTITKRTPKGKRLPPIPVGAPLKAALDAARVGRAKDERILLNSRGKPWSEDGFRVSFRAACRNAKVTGVTFHDLRGTAVSRLALAGATEPEIASITGHSLRDVRSMIDRYLHRDAGLAAAAIAKLEGVSVPTSAATPRVENANKIVRISQTKSQTGQSGRTKNPGEAQ